MKIKGAELLKKWNAANAVVSNINRLGEIGGIIRNAGFDVETDGFSVCRFRAKGMRVSFLADNCDTAPQWTLSKGICLRSIRDPLHIENIQPEAEYEVEELLTVAQEFERGDYNGYNFEVCDTRDHISTFASFEQADEYARTVCQSRIDSRWKDRDTTRYYWTRVENDEQMANERWVIRYYPWYSYNGHDYYISVSPVKRD